MCTCVSCFVRKDHLEILLWLAHKALWNRKLLSCAAGCLCPCLRLCQKRILSHGQGTSVSCSGHIPWLTLLLSFPVSQVNFPQVSDNLQAICLYICYACVCALGLSFGQVQFLGREAESVPQWPEERCHGRRCLCGLNLSLDLKLIVMPWGWKWSRPSERKVVLTWSVVVVVDGIRIPILTPGADPGF